MYCVKCGVKLQEGVESCPLCETPVWNPDSVERESSYPDTLPRQHRESDLPGAIAFTVICAIAILVTLIVCFRLYGSLNWGGYVVFGVLLFYVEAVLPRWFRQPQGQAFVPLDMLDTFKATVEGAIAPGCCHVLSIRPVGGAVI